MGSEDDQATLTTLRRVLPKAPPSPIANISRRRARAVSAESVEMDIPGGGYGFDPTAPPHSGDARDIFSGIVFLSTRRDRLKTLAEVRGRCANRVGRRGVGA